MTKRFFLSLYEAQQTTYNELKENQTRTDNWGAEDLRVPNYTIPLFFSMHSKILSFPPSIRPTSITNKNKFRFSSWWLTTNSISIWIFTSWCCITNPFTWSHKPLVTISLWICVWSFHSFIWTHFGSSKRFLLCLLLFFFENSHFIGSRHTTLHQKIKQYEVCIFCSVFQDTIH